MMEQYFLAVDIGASSGKMVLGWMEGERRRTAAVGRFPNGAPKKNGRRCWDVDALFSAIKAGLRRCAEIGKIPSTMGVDTWGVDFVLLDEAGRALGDAVSYRDGRTQRAAERVHEVLPFAKLYERTGIQYQPFNTVYQLYADKLSGKLKGAADFLMLPDYLNYCLTGVRRQEYTNATSTGMVNAKTHEWDDEIVAALGYDRKLFRPLSQPGTRGSCTISSDASCPGGSYR